MPLVFDNHIAVANTLNIFSARFDTRYCSGECDKQCQSIDSDTVTLVEGDVAKCLSRVKPNKAPGPNGLRGRVLKVCADQRCPFFTRFFHWLLNIRFMPRSWKISTFMPVPRKKERKKKSLVLDKSMTSGQ